MAYPYLVGVVLATVLLVTVLLGSTQGASLQLDKVVNPFREHLWSKQADLEEKWQVQVAIPSYLQEFLTLVQQTPGSSNGSEGGDKEIQPLKQIVLPPDFFDKLFDGVTSENCRGHVTEWYKRISAENITNLLGDRDKWVVQMVDAWGKIPEGVLSGHINSHGDFDECVQIEVKHLKILNDIYPKENIEKSFDGQYCTSYLVDYATAMAVTTKPVKSTKDVPEYHVAKTNSSARRREETPSVIDFLNMFGQRSAARMIPSVAVCFPNSCSVPDIQQILVNGLAQRYSENPDYRPEDMIWPLTMDCVDGNKPPLDAAAIVVIFILAFMTTLAFATGILDYWGIYADSENIVYKYLMAFSFYTNTKKWLSTRRSADDLGCLHGIRFLSTAWVVLNHTYVQVVVGPQWSVTHLRNMYKDWTFMTVMNGYYSVDTFFVMSGMLVTYSILRMLDRTKGKFNVIMFYVQRYLRLTPTYMILVAIGATLMSYAGNGPSWAGMLIQEEKCRKKWWANLLYVNNLLPSTYAMCNGESWYLANDMQFYVLSPLIVYPIWKKETIGVVLLSVYTVLSCIAPVLVVRYTESPAAMATTGGAMDNDPMEIYDRPWPRISAFLAGVWLGWILHKTRGKRLRIPHVVVLALWLCSTGIALSVIYGIFPWYDPKYLTIPEVAGYFYAGLCHFAWGVAISWVMFACIKGYGGIINRFLSWSAFMPLGRLCFCVYLISLHLQNAYAYRLTVPSKFDTYNIVNLFFSHMVSSFLVAFFFSMIFESPFIILIKLAFEGPGPSAKKKTPAETEVMVADNKSGTPDQADKTTS